MAKTPSTMLALGTPAPDFSLPDGSGQVTNLEDLVGKPLLVMFICNHCPFVIHIRSDLAALGKAYQSRGLAIVAINANDVASYPADAPDKMVQEAKSAGYTFPYLFDATQKIAQTYKAACTPDFYLFDAGHRLVYRGQYDDSRPSNGKPVTGHDLRAAADAVLSHKPVSENQQPSIGCNIKWKRGNAPSYFANA